jgi:hypothetical protein
MDERNIYYYSAVVQFQDSRRGVNLGLVVNRQDSGNDFGSVQYVLLSRNIRNLIGLLDKVVNSLCDNIDNIPM